MFIRTKIVTALAGLSLLGLAALGPAQAQSATFNFANDLGRTTTFTDTNDGISATFSSAFDPNIFAVQPSFFSNVTGNILGPGNGSPQFVALDIASSKALNSVSFAFGLIGPGNSTLTLTAYSGGLNGTKIGTAQARAVIPGGDYQFPEGQISFSAAQGFDTVEVTSTTAPNFAVGNVQVAAAPEPSQAAALALGVLGLAGLTLRARRRKGAA